MEKLNIIKIGGKVIDDPTSLARVLKDFASIEGLKILVHGGGKMATDFGIRMGLKPKFVEGRRITDRETLDLVTMVYAGLLNKTIVSQLQAYGANAIGLTGADGNMIRAIKRPIGKIDYGLVGDLDAESVNTKGINQLLANGILPVFCALTHDGNGALLNTNADTIASVLAASMSQLYDVQLVYCFEREGVSGAAENQQLLKEIDPASYADLVERGIITEGMIPKLDNAFDALNSGAQAVRIGHFEELTSLIKDLGKGTLIRL